MQKTFLATALVVFMAFGAPAFADSHGKPKPETPSEMIGEATRTILKAFELMMRSIPQDEVPEILENGDIIIRRKRPDAEKPALEKAPTKTKT